MAENNLQNALALNREETSEEICRFISDQVSETGSRGLVVGISGGLDSAVVASLGARALGADRVKGLFLPERDTEADSYACAREVAEATGIRYEEFNLTPALEQLGCYKGAVAEAIKNKAVNRLAVWGLDRFFNIDPYRITLERTDNRTLNRAIAFFRLKHRLRMAVLFEHSDRDNLLVAGCLNLTEYLTGFFVHFGDSAADLAPILDLYKSQVRNLARHLDLPRRLIEKAPSPDLLPGITDETALQVTYEKLDLILYATGKGYSEEEIIKAVKTTPETVTRVKRLVQLSERLRKPTPSPKLSGGRGC